MKKGITLLLIYVLSFSLLQAQEDNYYDAKEELEVEKEYPLFGNKVKMRAGPNLTAEVVTLLEIGKNVKIVRKTDNYDTFKGESHPWYEVIAGGQKGFILGALIANGSWESEAADATGFYFKIKESTDPRDGNKVMIKAYEKKEK